MSGTGAAPANPMADVGCSLDNGFGGMLLEFVMAMMFPVLPGSWTTTLTSSDDSAKTSRKAMYNSPTNSPRL